MCVHTLAHVQVQVRNGVSDFDDSVKRQACLYASLHICLHQTCFWSIMCVGSRCCKHPALLLLLHVCSLLRCLGLFLFMLMLHVKIFVMSKIIP